MSFMSHYYVALPCLTRKHPSVALCPRKSPVVVCFANGEPRTGRAMRPNDSSAQIDPLIDQYGPEIRKLIDSARRTLRSAFPGCAETADSKARLLGYGYGPGYKGTVSTLILSKTGVKIGIPFGASLKDPTHLLTGEGKVHRHVAVFEPADLKTPALKSLLRDALSAWKLRAGAAESRPIAAASLSRIPK